MEFDKDDVLAIVKALAELDATSHEKATLISSLLAELEKTLPGDHKTLDRVFELSKNPQDYNRDFCDPFFRVEKIGIDFKAWRIRGAVGRLAALPTDTHVTERAEAGTSTKIETLFEMVAKIKTELNLKPELTVMETIEKAELELHIDKSGKSVKERASCIVALF